MSPLLFMSAGYYKYLWYDKILRICGKYSCENFLTRGEVSNVNINKKKTFSQKHFEKISVINLKRCRNLWVQNISQKYSDKTWFKIFNHNEIKKMRSPYLFLKIHQREKQKRNVFSRALCCVIIKFLARFVIWILTSAAFRHYTSIGVKPTRLI